MRGGYRAPRGCGGHTGALPLITSKADLEAHVSPGDDAGRISDTSQPSTLRRIASPLRRAPIPWRHSPEAGSCRSLRIIGCSPTSEALVVPAAVSAAPFKDEGWQIVALLDGRRRVIELTCRWWRRSWIVASATKCQLFFKRCVLVERHVDKKPSKDGRPPSSPPRLAPPRTKSLRSSQAGMMTTARMSTSRRWTVTMDSL